MYFMPLLKIYNKNTNACINENINDIITSKNAEKQSSVSQQQ